MEVRRRIIINGTGSNGNNLIIDDGRKKLLIDLGVKFDEVLKSTNYKIDDWSAALCSHR